MKALLAAMRRQLPQRQRLAKIVLIMLVVAAAVSIPLALSSSSNETDEGLCSPEITSALRSYQQCLNGPAVGCGQPGLAKKLAANGFYTKAVANASMDKVVEHGPDLGVSVRCRCVTNPKQSCFSEDGICQQAFTEYVTLAPYTMCSTLAAGDTFTLQDGTVFDLTKPDANQVTFTEAAGDDVTFFQFSLVSKLCYGTNWPSATVHERDIVEAGDSPVIWYVGTALRKGQTATATVVRGIITYHLTLASDGTVSWDSKPPPP
jgi:hypothetical protein